MYIYICIYIYVSCWCRVKGVGCRKHGGPGFDLRAALRNLPHCLPPLSPTGARLRSIASRALQRLQASVKEILYEFVSI